MVQRAVGDAFCQKFGDMAAGVVYDLALDHGLAVVDGIVLQERGAAGVNLDLKRHAELAAVAEHVLVDGGQARWANILVIAGVEGAVLFGSVDELDSVAAADGPIAAAGTGAGLEDCAVEAAGLEFIGGDEAGDAATEDGDFDAFAQVRVEVERWFAGTNPAQASRRDAPPRQSRPLVVSRLVEDGVAEDGGRQIDGQQPRPGLRARRPGRHASGIHAGR